MAGAPADRADDVYSLGVFLFELLTGRPLPPPASDGYASIIDKGVLATEGEPIPDKLRELLKKSLVPRTERLNDVAAWHKTLNSWMFEGQYNPTTFNLAFFMHNLFRQEIERESQEIEVEKTLPVPVQRPASAAPAAAPTAAPPQEGTQPGLANEATENFIPEYAREDKKSKTAIYAGIAAVVVVILAAVGYFAWSGLQGGQEPQQVAAAPPVPPPAVEEPSGPTEDEIREQISALVDAQTSDMEEKFRAQYEQQLKDLENQLEEAKKVAERRRQQEQKKAEEEAARLAEQKKSEEAARLAEQKKVEEAARLAEQKKAEEEATRLAAAEPPPPMPTALNPLPLA